MNTRGRIKLGKFNKHLIRGHRSKDKTVQTRVRKQDKVFNIKSKLEHS